MTNKYALTIALLATFSGSVQCQPNVEADVPTSKIHNEEAKQEEIETIEQPAEAISWEVYEEMCNQCSSCMNCTIRWYVKNRINFSNNRFDNATFNETDFTDFTLEGSTFEQPEFNNVRGLAKVIEQCKVNKPVFVKQDMEGVDFTDKNLCGARFERTGNLATTNLDKANEDFSNITFEYQNMNGLDLGNKNLEGAAFYAALNLAAAHLENAQNDFSNIVFYTTNMQGVDLTNKLLKGATFSNVTNCDLTDALHNLSNTIFENQDMEEIKGLAEKLLVYALFYDVKNIGEVLAQADKDLSGITLEHINAKNIHLRNKILQKSRITKSTIQNLTIEDSNCRGLIIDDCDLPEFKLNGSDTRGMKVSGSDLASTTVHIRP